jgi:carbonic anhydrase/acetyltransferase-like protein (isoleucine patch superfamily)
MVAAGAVVTGGMQIPDETLAIGIPAKVKGPLAGTPAEFWVKMNPEAYRDLARRYRESLKPIT